MIHFMSVTKHGPKPGPGADNPAIRPDTNVGSNGKVANTQWLANTSLWQAILSKWRCIFNICRKRASVPRSRKFEEILSFLADILSKSGKVEPILSSRRAISRPIDKLFPWKISIIYQLGYWQHNFSKPRLSTLLKKWKSTAVEFTLFFLRRLTQNIIWPWLACHDHWTELFRKETKRSYISKELLFKVIFFFPMHLFAPPPVMLALFSLIWVIGEVFPLWLVMITW